MRMRPNAPDSSRERSKPNFSNTRVDLAFGLSTADPESSVVCPSNV
jgi:hypothetical protein